MLVKNLSYAYADKNLFQNFNFEFVPASMTLIQGPSGCGKSTFLKLIAGLLELQSGEVMWNQKSIFTYQKLIGYLHQDCHLIDHWTIAENLSLVSTDQELQKKLLNEFKLHMSLKTPTQQLSGGERQRVSLVRILLQNPEIVLLDEPTAHLDDEQTDIILKTIKNRLGQKTLIVVSHDQRLHQYADQTLNWKTEVKP